MRELEQNQKSNKMTDSKIKKSIELYNEGLTYGKKGDFKLAEEFYLKAIELNPEFFQAHYNLGNINKNSGKLNEAVNFFQKSIEIKSDFINGYYNLGNTLKLLGKLEEAEKSFDKVLELNPNLEEAKENLQIINELKELKSIVKPIKNIKKIITNTNTFKTFREVEPSLIDELYKIRTLELDKSGLYDARYGNGKFSNFELLQNESSVIRKAKHELVKIMEDAVKGKIYIKESFFNIFKTGSGVRPHAHFSDFDKNMGYEHQKFSLVYYLSVGDQKSSEPGILNLYDPKKEILPSNGLLLIFPATQKHAASYNGKEDRIMIGINFYSYK